VPADSVHQPTKFCVGTHAGKGRLARQLDEIRVVFLVGSLQPFERSRLVADCTEYPGDVDPLSFPSNGPVLNFFDANGNPLAGVTVDSSDGCIVNNRFLCGAAPTPAPEPTPVPEPAIWTLLLVGFAGLVNRARRHRVSPAASSSAETPCSAVRGSRRYPGRMF
jgi:MYXO-CTERM domain-containing protein